MEFERLGSGWHEVCQSIIPNLVPTKMTRRLRARNWVFTLNNPGQSYATYALNYTGHKHFRFLVFQKEKGDNGTVHYQGYVQFKSTMGMSALKKLDARAHWEPRKGSHRQALDYSTKLDTRLEGPWKYGIGIAGGTRTDILAFKEAIKAGKSEEFIADNHTSCYIRYGKGYDRLRQLYKPEHSGVITVKLLYGETGTGKTLSGTEMAAEHASWWEMPVDQKFWFDGYRGQEAVLLDDFVGAASHWRLDAFLRLTNPRTLAVPKKGGHTWWYPKTVVITSNIHPYKWWDFESRYSQLPAVARRFAEIWWYRKDEDPVRVNSSTFFDEWVEFRLPEKYCKPLEDDQ